MTAPPLVSRGGFAWTRQVNQRLGHVIAQRAASHSLSPNQLSLANLLVGTLTSLALLLLAHSVNNVVLGLVAWFGWQIAYTLDCADGQLARLTGASSARGAILDVFCDFAVQFSVVLALVQVSQSYAEPRPMLVAFASGGWLLGTAMASLLTASDVSTRPEQRSGRVLANLQDYGFHIALLATLVVLHPAWVLYAIAGIASLHTLGLAVRILRLARS
jgi:phosphatidylglycerophosphate synthase